MARGAIAKDDVAKKLAAAFGADFLGEYDKKYYVLGVENGEKIQIAISMTCPKTPVEFATVASPASSKPDFMSFEDEPAIPTLKAAPVSAPPVVEISQEERDNIAELMARLGL